MTKITRKSSRNVKRVDYTLKEKNINNLVKEISRNDKKKYFSDWRKKDREFRKALNAYHKSLFQPKQESEDLSGLSDVSDISDAPESESESEDEEEIKIYDWSDNYKDKYAMLNAVKEVYLSGKKYHRDVIDMCLSNGANMHAYLSYFVYINNYLINKK